MFAFEHTETKICFHYPVDLSASTYHTIKIFKMYVSSDPESKFTENLNQISHYYSLHGNRTQRQALKDKTRLYVRLGQPICHYGDDNKNNNPHSAVKPI